MQKARRFALLAGLSVGLIMLQSSSAAIPSSPKNHRMTNDKLLERRSDEELAHNSTPSASAPEFVIGSLEDERKFGMKIVDKRHHYEQPQVGPVEKQLDQVAAPAVNQQEEAAAPERQQMEARNEQESAQLSEQQQQPTEQVIIDHRPSGSDSFADLGDQFGQASSTQSPPISSTSSSPNTAASAQSSSSTMSPFNNQQASGPSSSAMSGQTAVQWIPAASNQQVIYARQAQPTSPNSNSNNNNNNQQQQQFGNVISSSNQVMSSVQYPTSINSIISEQQQQTSGQQQQVGQFQTQIVNGQQQLVFVPAQNGAASSVNAQFVGMAPNGRRMSISNWLRGLGSMLSNIFYRRDHSALGNAHLQAGNMMMQASGSAPAGSWIQLGPNAPHWLTQAQSAIQQFQQQHQQLALPGSSRISSFLSGNGQQQAANTLSATLPQQQLGGSNIFQQPQQMADLQTSGSSNSYAAIQTPNGNTQLATNQPYQQTLGAQGQSLLVGQLQAAMANGAQGLQIPQQAANIQVVAAPQQQQPTSSFVTKSNSDQTKQVASTTAAGQSQSSIAPPSSGTTQTRFSRSSRQQAKSQQQQTTSTPTTQTTNANLPLAHYSHYSASD